MNYSPSSGFWAVSANNTLANKPQFLSELDATKTTMRLKWDSDHKMNLENLKKVIMTCWKLPSPEIGIDNNLAYVSVNREDLKSATISKLLYVGGIVVNNLSFNPRKNKPSLMTRVKELIQETATKGTAVDLKHLATNSSLEMLEKRVKTLESCVKSLEEENSALKSNLEKLVNKEDFKNDMNQVNIKTTNVGKDLSDFKSFMDGELKNNGSRMKHLNDSMTDINENINKLKESIKSAVEKVKSDFSSEIKSLHSDLSLKKKDVETLLNRFKMDLNKLKKDRSDSEFSISSQIQALQKSIDGVNSNEGGISKFVSQTVDDDLDLDRKNSLFQTPRKKSVSIRKKKKLGSPFKSAIVFET
ncbi:predicted protein [Naegleria gruberi]|uniref:Predicted protein n=1 Tax=Naegleria gruberi TaxID=5762 RepID=D2W6T2_NAEGR|nr:uncharacterized protein NAEGRDRAFT_77126 [Naegleria gruberi]EFC35220.1 predicted protein [Naegleria gruberi]|eukprot:XP_002667964.1 predicted protein [Naegleria gruberi strain NEG-M]